MSFTAEQVEEAKNAFLEVQPDIERISKELRTLKKTQTRAKKIIRAYMEQTQMTTLDVGNTQFNRAVKDKVVCTMDRVEETFGAEAAQRFGAMNTEPKVVFSAKKRRRS